MHFLSCDVLNRHLKLALQFAHKKVVNENIIVLGIQFILYSDQLKQWLFVVVGLFKDVHSLQETNEAGFIAMYLRSHQISNFKDD